MTVLISKITETIQTFDNGLLVSQLHAIMTKQNPVSYSTFLKHLKATPALKIYPFKNTTKSLYVSIKSKHSETMRLRNVMLAQWYINGIIPGKKLRTSVDDCIAYYDALAKIKTTKDMDASRDYLKWYKAQRLAALNPSVIVPQTPDAKPFITLYGFIDRNIFFSIDAHKKPIEFSFHWLDIGDGTIQNKKFQYEIINILSWMNAHSFNFSVSLHVYTWSDFVKTTYEKRFKITTDDVKLLHHRHAALAHEYFEKHFKGVTVTNLGLSKIFHNHLK